MTFKVPLKNSKADSFVIFRVHEKWWIVRQTEREHLFSNMKILNSFFLYFIPASLKFCLTFLHSLSTSFTPLSTDSVVVSTD